MVTKTNKKAKNAQNKKNEEKVKNFEKKDNKTKKSNGEENKSNQDYSKENSYEESKNIKKLYRSKEDKTIAGVCGGIGEYLSVDPIWIRLIMIILVFFEGAGILIYIVLWILMPENPYQKSDKKTYAEKQVDTISKKIKDKNDDKIEEEKLKDPNFREKYMFKRDKEESVSSNSHMFIGVIMILIGLLFLAKEFYWSFLDKIFWPAIIIGIGLILLIRR